MNIILQIPIIDLRPATPTAKIKLANPSWPLPKLNKKPFIRHFGNVQHRYMGGIDEWSGEEYFCNCSRAITYVDLHKQSFTAAPNLRLSIKNTFKRFYSDGLFMNKIELGLKDNSYQQMVQMNNTANEINLTALLKHYMSLPVKVNGKNTKLFKSGPLLSSLYYESSTRHHNPKNDLSSFVQDGEICLLAIVPILEKYIMPQEAKLIDTIQLPSKIDSLQLYGYTLHIEGYYIKVWILMVPEKGFSFYDPAYAFIRNLRINLMRVHAEKETVKSILNAVRQKSIDLSSSEVNSQVLSDYLKDTSEKIFKKTRYNIPQKSMLDFALRSENTASPGSFSSLNKQIKDNFTMKNIKKFIDKSTSKDKKIILFIYSSPSDKNLLDFGKEFKVIKDLLKKSSDRANYTIEFEPHVSRTGLAEILATYKPDILHLTMHGSKTVGLYFEDEAGNQSPMDAEEWYDILKVQTSIHKPQIIVLSACNSQLHAERARLLCKFVAGTKTVFPEAAGVAYAKGFYSVLFNDESTGPEVCHQAGVNAIKYYKPPFQAINNMNVYDIISIL